MDKDRCPKLSNIYDSGNTFLYGATFNQTFPGCSGVTPPGEKKCVVCDDQNNLKIICSEDVGRLEVEHSDGGTIEDISPNCTYYMFDLMILRCFCTFSGQKIFKVKLS